MTKAQCIAASVAVLVATMFCGCVSKSTADARARAAYLAGQRAAYASMAGDGQSVVIIGPVGHPKVPWIEGLTLAQAIATANYTGNHAPKTITISRPAGEINVNPHDLLSGNVVTLEPGDRVTIQE